jgi:hypothetical protein
VKRVNFTVRIQFDIGVKAYNLFNHSQFVGGAHDVAPIQTEPVSTAFLEPRNPNSAIIKPSSRTMRTPRRLRRTSISREVAGVLFF